MPGSILGTAVRRVEDQDLVVGHGTFVDNHVLDGKTHAVFVRSPFAHARITAIDTSEATGSPGVLAVLTAADLDDAPVPSFISVNPQISRPALARDRVRFVGEQVALVVAETRAQAVDAAELVDVDYEELPAVVDVEAALREDAPLQYPDVGSNVAAARRLDGEGDPFEGAAHVVRLRLENQRLAVAPIEGHAILVDPTSGPEGGITVWLSTQHPHLSRDLFARYTGLEKEQVRVIAPHVGGAFGGKAGMVTEHAAVVTAARQVGRPVAWTETRSEAMLSMHGRGQVQYAEAAVTHDGTVTALRLRILGDCGAHAGFGGALAVGPTFTMAQGPYAVPRLDYAAISVLTNTAPVGAFRGAGRPEAAALLERLMDHVARELGLPPEDVRRRNLLQPDDFPFTTHTGATYDTGDYDLPLREALRIADVDGAREEQRRRRLAGDSRQLGIGIAVYVEITGGAGGGEFGSVQIGDDGHATVMAGTSAHGQGHATSFSMIVADTLGLPMDHVHYVQSDTALVRSGGGTGGSRSLQLGGSAVATAADAVREQALALASDLLEVDVADLEVADGRVGVRGVPTVTLSWAQLAARAIETDGSLGADLDFTQEGATFPFGAHVSIVEVDTETGRTTPLRHVAVDDCGRVLNPLIVEGQQHGGAIQGISQALWEQFVYDDAGQPLTSTFADYTMPTTADTISLEVSTTETTTPLNPLGAKGIGESATVGSTPAVQNAVIDAISHLGVRHVDLPCTPQRVWAALQGAASRPEGEQQSVWREPPSAFDDIPRAERAAPADEGAI